MIARTRHAFAQAPGDGLREDPAKAVILSACTSYHDVGLITAGPRTPDEWEVLVGKMIDRGAALNEDEKTQVRAHLVKNFGAPATPAALAPTPPAPGR